MFFFLIPHKSSALAGLYMPSLSTSSPFPNSCHPLSPPLKVFLFVLSLIPPASENLTSFKMQAAIPNRRTKQKINVSGIDQLKGW